MRSGYLFLLSIISLFLSNEGHATQSVYDILKKADESRGNVVGISWEVVIESIEADRTTDTVVYNIKARGFDISGLSLEPPKYKGNKVLMTNNNMWFYKPGLSKPIPIAQRQKLMGNAAYGDIASTNYAEDYEPAALPDEIVDGEDCYVFDLKSKSDKTTYDKIKYWVSKKRLVGIKADYYTVSGKKFKTANMEYSNTVKVDGKTRPFISKITMRDTLINENVTYMNMNKPRLEPLPDYIFNLNLFMK
ncbi:outer membrane lipoprotein-sorting protein [Methylococcus geothermalis]|uniref:Outer membrane lipoprotein-sorting protein n=1 Tax=Methylococcus geothermalis TaxID=2681310 RepID=A0A858Q9P6_9GAMM|nr:outer membrane lipoprotein-sorting protein [Methylococcus geothermalis]